MLTTLLLVVGLAQSVDPAPFLWRIEGLGEPRKDVIVVTVEPTAFGLSQKLDVRSISLEPLPTRRDPRPRALHPLVVEPSDRWGLRASFTTPARRFHLRVTLSDGSTHAIDIYRRPPRADNPGALRMRVVACAPGYERCARV